MIFDIFGTIDSPAKFTQGGYGELTDSSGGLVNLVNNLLGLITTIAGIFTVVNLVLAGYLYLSSNGEPQKITTAGNKIIQTAIGIGVVALAYVIAAVVGQVLFNDSTMLLKPTLFKIL